MPGRKADTSRRESRLEDIKNAALKEFYQRGYAATDLRAIAREVGLHVSSLYNYISSKQQLLYLIATQYVEDSTRSLTEAIAGIADPVERLRSAIRSHVLLMAELQHAAWAMYTELRYLEDEYSREVRGAIRNYDRIWEQLLQDGISAGRLRPVDVPVTIRGLHAMVISVARWYDPNERLTAEEIADLYADIAIRGLLVDRPATDASADAESAGSTPTASASA